MSQNNIFFSISTQYENLGDALINRELIKAASRYGNVKIDTSRCPASFAETLGLNDFESSEQNKFDCLDSYLKLMLSIIRLRAKKQKVYFFLNPGGLGKKLNTKQKLQTLINNLILLMYRLIGVNVCQVGVSFDKMPKQEMLLYKMRARAVKHLFVRDTGSYSYLTDNNIKVKGVYPDLAFYLFSERAKNHLDIPGDERNCIAFSFRLDEANVLSIEHLYPYISSIVESNPSCNSFKFVSQVKRDDDKMEQLSNWFKDRYEHSTELITCSDDIEYMNSVYSSCHQVYSNRLHVLLLAASNGAEPVASICKGHNQKIDNLFRDLELSGHISYINSNEAATKADLNWYAKMNAKGEQIERMLPDIMGNLI